MTSKPHVSFLERCGLTFEKLAAAACGPRQHEIVRRQECFSIRMINDVMVTLRDRPSVPVAKGRLELVRVEQQGDLLTIVDIRGRRHRGSHKAVESGGARLYAVKTFEMNGATTYMFLSEPPAGISDDIFSSAEGTVVLYDNAPKGPRVLKACGTDRNGDRATGWIFHAIEA